MKNFILLCLLSMTIACSSLQKNMKPTDSPMSDVIVNLDQILNDAEEEATPVGKKVLSTGRGMMEKKKVIKGSCWDYVNAVYNKAGVSPNQRITPLRNKIQGPYADVSTILPGDWLYFINHSFKEIDHSGIFVRWTDFERRRAVLLSYVGGRKKKPGNYKIYDLSHVYYIIRAK